MYKTLDGFVTIPKLEIQPNLNTLESNSQANIKNNNQLPKIPLEEVTNNQIQGDENNVNLNSYAKTAEVTGITSDVFNIDYSDYDYSNIIQIKNDLFVKLNNEYSSQIQITTQADLFDQASVFRNTRERDQEFAQISRYKKTWYQKLGDLTKVKIYEGNFVLYRPFPVIVWNTMKNLSRNNTVLWFLFGFLFILTISFQIKLAKASPIINYISAEKQLTP